MAELELIKEKVVKEKKMSAGAFHTLNLPPFLLQNIRKLGYKQPTPIQRKAIPLLLSGGDVVGMARTGSGKTAAFAIPMLQRLKEHSMVVGVRGLIMSPTRELALQTVKCVSQLARGSGIRVAGVVGGESMEEQFALLAKNPDILIATPGRLLHLAQEAKLSLSRVQLVVLDEADRLFEMGLAEQLSHIVCRMLPQENRQTALFSATLPSTVAEFASVGLRKERTVFVRLDAELKLSPDLSVQFLRVNSEYRSAACLVLLQHIYRTGDNEGRQASPLTIIFTATKHHVEYISELLGLMGYEARGVYGSMDQTARVQALEAFRSGRSPVLVVTDVAARGLDIPLLDNVINYDMPSTPRTFIHRVGRAARAGRTGSAYSLCSLDELAYFCDLQNTLFASSTSNDGNLPAELHSFPQDSLDVFASRISSLHSLTSNTLDSAWKVVQNACKQYHKSREPPSSEAISQARATLYKATHPIALQYSITAPTTTVANSNGAEALKAAIHNYKPRDASCHLALPSGKIANKKSKTLVGAGDSSRTQRPRNYVDEEYYMSYRPKSSSFLEDRAYSLNNLRSVAVDPSMSREDPFETRRIMDGGRNKSAAGSAPTNSTTSSSRKRQKGELYEQWKRKNRIALPKVGESELPERVQSSLGAAKKKYYGKKRKNESTTKRRRCADRNDRIDRK